MVVGVDVRPEVWDTPEEDGDGAAVAAGFDLVPAVWTGSEVALGALEI